MTYENANREDEWNTDWSYCECDDCSGDDFRFEETEGGKLIEGLRRDVVEAFDVPNDWLPEVYRTEGTHRPLANVEKQYKRVQAKRAEKQAKADHEAAKARNVERYAKQFEELVERDANGSFVTMANGFDRSEIECDDDGKYRWEMAFIKATRMEIE